MKIKRLTTLLTACALLIGVISGLSSLTVLAVEETYTMSDQYKSSKYYEHFKRVELTGDQITDVIAIALSQLGYHEGDGDDDLGGNNPEGTKNFVEYNVLRGKLDNQEGNGLSYGYAWCASFVNWCLRQARVDKAASGSEISCRRWLADCKDMGIYADKEGYSPKTADIIFFKDADSAVTSTHVGFVLYSDEERVYTIEGNASSDSILSTAGNYVCLKSYELSDSYIVAYASPKYKTDDTIPTIDRTGKEMTSGLYISKDKVINIYSDLEMSQATDTIGAHELLVVTERYGDSFKIKYQKDGESREGYASLENAAVQMSADGATVAIDLIQDPAGEQIARYALLPSSVLTLPKPNTEGKAAGFLGWRLEGTDELLRASDTLCATDQKMTLVAEWDETLYTVTFVDTNGAILKEIKGYYGDTIEPPAVTAASFAGWGIAELPSAITGNATYTATYSSNGCKTSTDIALLSILIAIAFVSCRKKRAL